MDYTLYNDDCLNALKTMEDNSIDSCVTDPPYGLSFMGKTWDYDVPQKEIWEEVFRVLKPGGHLLAFFGSRTYHRGVVQIEDAGFEVRDQIMWLYGCLSEDTQIVTPDGNKPYTTINPGDLVLCYDKYSKEYSYQAVEEVYEYDIKDTAYRIQSDYTDQIVSRNHRCLVERGGKEVFVFAEELKEKENISFLENLSVLQSTISNSHKRTGNKEQNLLQRMYQSIDWFEKFSKFATRKTIWYGTSSLFSLWNYILPQQKAFETSREASMFLQMQWSPAWGGIEKTRPQGQTKLEPKIRGRFDRADDRGNQSELEWWYNLQTPQRKSQGSEVCSLPERLFENGKKRWIYYGTQTDCGKTNQPIAYQNGSGSSYKSRSTGQSHRESDAICKQQGPQTVREWSGHKTTLATITPFEYEGKVWCVKVPTGSFVAARNGKAFTTGNSGFPKSHNIGKAIDKDAGATRKVVSTRKLTGKARVLKGGNYDGSYEDKELKTDYEETEPATDEAKQWEGWGTALKPAHEPIVVARKPITQTVAKNVLKYGTGALNIDGCRVGFQSDNDKNAAKPQGKATSRTGQLAGKNGSYVILGEDDLYWSNEDGWVDRENATVFYEDENNIDPIGTKKRVPATDRNDFVFEQKDGRWPANVIHDGSDEVVSGFPDTKSGVDKGQRGTGGIWQKSSGVPCGPQYGDSGPAARFFYCAKASKSDRDEGNNHPTVKPTELMKYMCRLVTPKNGTVLDPFMGSGSTGKAAMIEGFCFVGIERDKDYFEIAEKRIEAAKNNIPLSLEDYFS